MKLRACLLAGLGALSLPAAAFDRSCNALQLVQQTNRVARLPAAEQQRYQGTIERFDREMRGLFDRTREQGRRLENVQTATVEATLQARRDLVERAQNRVLRDNPSLAERGAEQRLQLAVLQELNADREYAREVQRRLHADRSFDSAAASVMRAQVGEYHDLERRQYDALLKVPPPQAEYERKAAAANAAASRHVVGAGAATAGVASSSAFRELVVGVAAAQAGTRASLKQEGLEFAVSEIRKPFEERGDAVVDAAASVRGAVRHLESMRLRSELDFQHADVYVAPPAERSRAAADRSRELPQVVSESVARAINTRVGVETAYRPLSKITVPPPPPPAAPPAQQRSWGEKVKETITEAVDAMTYVLID